ncbi:hypothetical protein UFOVP138_30 [uncultured Caudovirales phage]|uniref:Uncharacterized protein n=1 Tax=uncultured Caudovirales phage TaxID=2100421 RepID=A0A6J5LK98_9CAUD|nr:hypothetical protein UFOVP138_30 [uncultured Caudovirales phage]
MTHIHKGLFTRKQHAEFAIEESNLLTKAHGTGDASHLIAFWTKKRALFLQLSEERLGE